MTHPTGSLFLMNTLESGHSPLWLHQLSHLICPEQRPSLLSYSHKASCMLGCHSANPCITLGFHTIHHSASHLICVQQRSHHIATAPAGS
jgi:hypothetical protein